MARRKKGTPPAYRHHKRTGQAVVTVNGRDVYLGKHGTKKSRERYSEIIARLDDPTATPADVVARTPPASIVTVNDAILAFFAHAQTYYVKDGRQTNEVDAYRLLLSELRTLFGETPLEDFSPKRFKALRQVWIDRGLARSTVNKNAVRARSFVKWCVSEELCSPSVFHGVSTVNGLRRGRCSCPEPEPVAAVDDDVLDATLPHLTPVIRDAVRVQRLTGMRSGEVLRMTPGAVDTSGPVWIYRDEAHKTAHHGHTRNIALGPKAIEIIRPYLARPSDALLFTNTDHVEQGRAARSAARKTPASCGNARGRRSNADRPGVKPRKHRVDITPENYHGIIDRACRKAFPAPLSQAEGESNAARMRRLTKRQREELAKWHADHRWHPHQLRHRWITEATKRFGVEITRAGAGHTQTATTELYVERDLDAARRIAGEIG